MHGLNSWTQGFAQTTPVVKRVALAPGFNPGTPNPYIAYRENPWIVHSTRGAAHVYPQIMHWSLNLSTPEIHHLTEHVDSEWQGPSVCFAWILLEEISEKCLCLKFGHPLVIIFPIFPLKNVGNGHAKISSKTLLMTITAMTSGHLYDIRGIPSIGGSLGDTSK